MEEVHDGRAFSQELGIGHDVKQLAPHTVALDHAPDPLVGVDRHRAFLDKNRVVGDMPGDLAGHGFHIGKIGVPGLRLGRAHGDKDGTAGLCRLGKVGGEADPSVAVPVHQLRQVILVNDGIALA